MIARTSLFLIALGLICSVVLYVFSPISAQGSEMVQTAVYVLRVTGYFALAFLISYGSLIHSVIKYLVLSLGVLYVMGWVFKIMHWPFAHEMILFGMAGIGLSYTVHFFINKRLRHWVDILKLLYVLGFVIVSSLVMIKYLPEWSMLVVYAGAACLAFVYVFGDEKGKEALRTK